MEAQFNKIREQLEKMRRNTMPPDERELFDAEAELERQLIDPDAKNTFMPRDTFTERHNTSTANINSTEIVVFGVNPTYTNIGLDSDSDDEAPIIPGSSTIIAASTEAVIAASTEAVIASSTDAVIAASTEAAIAASTEAVIAASTEAVIAASTEAVIASSTDAVIAASTEAVIAASTEAVIASSTDAVIAASTEAVISPTETVTKPPTLQDIMNGYQELGDCHRRIGDVLHTIRSYELFSEEFLDRLHIIKLYLMTNEEHSSSDILLEINEYHERPFRVFKNGISSLYELKQFFGHSVLGWQDRTGKWFILDFLFMPISDVGYGMLLDHYLYLHNEDTPVLVVPVVRHPLVYGSTCLDARRIRSTIEGVVDSTRNEVYPDIAELYKGDILRKEP